VKLNWKNGVIAMVTMLFLVGCTVTKEKEVTADSTSITPKRKPIYNQTNMESALQCIDQQLLSDPKTEKIKLYVDSDFPDLGSAGVRSTRDMLITALMKLSASSRKVGAIIYQQGSDLGFMSDASPAGTAFQFPKYFLRGSITQAEKEHSIGGKTKSFSVGVPRVLSAGTKDSTVTSISSVGLDLHLGELGTLELIPGMYSSNMLSIVQQDESGDVYAGIIDKVDYEYDVEFSEREGMSAAVRALAELAVIEIIGKLFELDYQRCINPIGVTDERGRRESLNKVILLQSGSDLASKEVVVPKLTTVSDMSLELEPESIATHLSVVVYSEQGKNPQYRSGEVVRFGAIPESDLFLYCFYSSPAKREVIQLFPNRYSLQAHRMNGESVVLPSPDMPFQFVADEKGRDHFDCFGVRNEITMPLEARLGKQPLESIKMRIDEVKQVIHQLSNGQVAHDQITITVQ
jgi:hypothetical protein